MRITWAPVCNSPLMKDNAELGVVYYAPESLYKVVSSVHKDQTFLRCPAFVDSLRNTYLIRSPYSMTIHIVDGVVTVDGFGQDFFDTNVVVHSANVLGLPPRYVFIADEPVELELLPTILCGGSMQVVVGKFDISKWIRPVELAFVTGSPKIVIKRGDPLYCVRFNTSKEVKLEQTVISELHLNAISACVNLKNVSPNLKLQNVYDTGKSYVDAVKKLLFKRN